MEVPSSSNAHSAIRKPVIVRVKRKHAQPFVESLLLEVLERPSKRLEAEFSSLSVNDGDRKGPGNGMASKPPRLLFHHVDTVTSFGTEEATRMNALLAELQDDKVNGKHRTSIKSMNSGKPATTSRLKHQAFAQKARFEQVWRSRKGQNADVVAEAFHLYDIVRIDADQEAIERHHREELARKANEEEKRLLQQFLPLFEDYLPEVAAEVATTSSESRDEYVYDIYALHECMEEESTNVPECPMVQVVDEEELSWGFSSESEHDSEDSNDENNPLNDYPEEEDDSELGLDSEEATQSGSEILEEVTQSGSEISDLEDNDVVWDESEYGSENYYDEEDL